MSEKQLIVRVHADGTIDAETIGMYGDECLEYFEALEDLLDAQTSSSAYTADYDRTPDTAAEAARTVRDGDA